MLLAAAIIWGLGTIAIKDSVSDFSPLWVVALRFLGAGVILIAIFFKHLVRHITKEALIASIFLGFFLGLCYMGNSIGLRYTTASVSAVLSSAYTIIVVFLGWPVLHIRPSFLSILAALLCLGGIALAALSHTNNTLHIGKGELYTLFGALAFAVHVTYTAKFAQTQDALTLTVIQIPIVGIFAAGVAFVLHGALPATMLIRDSGLLINIIYLTLGATVVAITLQNIGVAHVTPSQASLILSTETIFAILFAGIILHEALTARVFIGFILVMTGLIISEAVPHRRTHYAKYSAG